MKLKVGDRITVTKWYVSPGSEHDENKLNPPPLSGEVMYLVRDETRAAMGQIASIKFDNGSRLFILEDDEWELESVKSIS